MKSVLIVFFILTFLLMILAFPFKVRMMMHANLIELKIFYCFKIWRMKFLCGKVIFGKDGEINVENSNNLLDGGFDKVFMQKLVREIISKIDVKKIELFFTGGFVDDSYSSAIMCGTITSLVQTIYSYFSQRYENVKMYEDITPTFYETNLELTFDAVISVSLLQIIVSVFKANKLKKRIFGGTK